MAGHSKWANIKHRKAATDAKRGKVFTMHAKLITIAARAGGDPEMNANLRAAIDRAKADNVPNANIDRAIKKGTGEDKDGVQYEEITYEAMGPGGSSFMIDVITDNKNRSNTNVKTILSKNGGTQGNSAWKFDRLAFFSVDLKGKDLEEAELVLIDGGAEDFRTGEEGQLGVYAPLNAYAEVKAAIEAAGFAILKDEIVWKAKNEVLVDDASVAQRILKLIDLLEEDDDVNNVYTDVDFAPSILDQIGY